mmetsp:Transcript_128840/g.222479  ORF Transcript_128840/g.222479 Transcript_128840/m.222479 type:complete len:122 (+) Transcript_128840:363-728(+)
MPGASSGAPPASWARCLASISAPAFAAAFASKGVPAVPVATPPEAAGVAPAGPERCRGALSTRASEPADSELHQGLAFPAPEEGTSAGCGVLLLMLKLIGSRVLAALGRFLCEFKGVLGNG